jgi:hypothetical protein
MPDVRGAAELIVFLRETPEAKGIGSIFDLFGKAPQLRTAEDIDAQVRAEPDAWGDL